MSSSHRKSATRHNAEDLRGLSRLGVSAVTGVTDVVEAVHRTITGLTPPLGAADEVRTRGIAGLVYSSVRGVTRGVGSVIERAIDLAAPWLGATQPSAQREAVLAALNGTHGDHLEESGNPLAIRMSLRRAGVPLTLTPEHLAGDLPDMGPHALVLIHGLCMTDHQWLRQGHDHGAALAREHGYTPVYLHYNSGRAVSSNGAELAQLLQTLVQAWPVPLQSLTLLGHSMGGLLARSACYHAQTQALSWREQLAALVFLGTPHQGSPLERAGSKLDWLIGLSPYSAPIARVGRSRSAGIRDLHSGLCTPAGMDVPVRTGVPERARCYAVAASRSEHPHTTKRPKGDGLVPVSSALGQHADPQRDLGIDPARQLVLGGIGHFDLLNDARAYAALSGWLATQSGG